MPLHLNWQAKKVEYYCTSQHTKHVWPSWKSDKKKAIARRKLLECHKLRWGHSNSMEDGDQAILITWRSTCDDELSERKWEEFRLRQRFTFVWCNSKHTERATIVYIKSSWCVRFQQLRARPEPNKTVWHNNPTTFHSCSPCSMTKLEPFLSKETLEIFQSIETQTGSHQRHVPKAIRYNYSQRWFDK